MIDYALQNKENIKLDFKRSQGLRVILRTNNLDIDYITTELLEKFFKQAILSFISRNHVFHKKQFNNQIIVNMLAQLGKIITDNSKVVTNSPGPAPNPTKGGGRGWFDWFKR